MSAQGRSTDCLFTWGVPKGCDAVLGRCNLDLLSIYANHFGDLEALTMILAVGVRI